MSINIYWLITAKLVAYDPCSWGHCWYSKQWYITISTRVNCVTKYTHLNMRVESHKSVCYIFAFHSLANFRILQRQIGIPTAAMTILALVLWGLNIMTSFFADGIWYHLIKKIDEKWQLYITVPDLRLHGQWNYPDHICKNRSIRKCNKHNELLTVSGLLWGTLHWWMWNLKSQYRTHLQSWSEAPKWYDIEVLTFIGPHANKELN